jgi:hypothetical protein
MRLVSIYLTGLIVCMLYIGCSSGEYELSEVKVEYNEKQLVYDTIETTSKDITTQNSSFTFIVQIGAFLEKEHFDSFFETSRVNLGDAVYYQLINDLYKIRIGNYNNKAQAIKMLDYVKSIGYDDAFIITVKNK